MSVSMSGGNQSALAPRLAEPISVIECATVKDVTMAMSGRRRRIGMTRQKRNRR